MDDKDVASILQMMTAVSHKLTLLPSSTCHLTVATCKHILHVVLAHDRPKDLNQYFECLECCLHHIKVSNDLTGLVTMFEIIEHSYLSCSDKYVSILFCG